MEEGGPSFSEFFFFLSDFCRHVTCPKKVGKRGQIGVIPHHHTIIGTKGEVQGWWGRSVEVGGGDLDGG